MKNEKLQDAPRGFDGSIDNKILEQPLKVDYKDFVDYHYEINNTNLVKNMNDTKKIRTKTGFDTTLNNSVLNYSTCISSSSHVSASFLTKTKRD